METKKSKFGLFILFSLLFFSLIGSVFGADNSCPKYDGKDIFGYMNQSDSITCLFQKMNWLNWAIYIALIFLVGNILSNLFGNSKGSKFGAYLLAFMSITGFMWVLLKNNILPNYLIFWAGELLVITFVIILIKIGFKLSSKSEKGFNSYLKWIGLVLGLLILVQYNNMVANIGENHSDMMFKAGSNTIFEDTMLGKIVGITGILSFLGDSSVIIVLVISLIIFSIAETKFAREKVRGPLGNYLNKLRELNEKHEKRDKLVREVGDLYKKLKGINKILDDKLRININNIMIQKLNQIMKIDKINDESEDNNVTDFFNTICQNLIGICQKDNKNPSEITANDEREREILIGQLLQKTGALEEQYREFTNFSKAKINNIEDMLNKIRNIKLKERTKEEHYHFNETINYYLNEIFNKKYNNIKEYEIMLSYLLKTCELFKNTIDDVNFDINTHIEVLKILTNIIDNLNYSRPTNEIEINKIITADMP